ncbi:MAG: hypothetical protein ACHQK8_02730, partial [Bacteroidia bacterium]
MKKSITLFSILSVSFFAFAQSVSRDYAVMIQSTVSVSPPSITLKWQNIAGTRGMKIYRKNKNSVEWGAPIAVIGTAATQFTDNNVVAGNAYEYYVKRIDASDIANGYIYVGIKLPETTYRGKLLLLVDANYTLPLANEISQLQNDLIGDGWQVKRIDISRTSTVK